MAAQLAVLVARRLGCRCAMREVDEERAAAGRDAGAGARPSSVARRGRIDGRGGRRGCSAPVTVGTDLAALAGADLVVEAVTEVLDVKQAVFAELEDVVGPRRVLATNTSALSVTAMAAGLRHPERVVGLHFFNPVAQMPLVEVVRADAHRRRRASPPRSRWPPALRKTAVGGRRPARLRRQPAAAADARARSRGAVESGHPGRGRRPRAAPAGAADGAVRADPARRAARRAARARARCTTELGDRYPLSPGLERLARRRTARGPRPDGRGADQHVDPAIQDAFGEPGGPGAAGRGRACCDAVLDGLAEEVGLMLDEGVVTVRPSRSTCAWCSARAGRSTWAGSCPYLDRSGLAGARARPTAPAAPASPSVPAVSTTVRPAVAELPAHPLDELRRRARGVVELVPHAERLPLVPAHLVEREHLDAGRRSARLAACSATAATFVRGVGQPGDQHEPDPDLGAAGREPAARSRASAAGRGR